MLRVFSPTGFNVKFTPFHLFLNHGFLGFHGFGFSVWVIRRLGTLYPFFRRCVTHRLFGGAIFKVYNFTLRPE